MKKIYPKVLKKSFCKDARELSDLSIDDPLSEMDKNEKLWFQSFYYLKNSNKTIVTFSNSAMIEEIADTNLNLNGI